MSPNENLIVVKSPRMILWSSRELEQALASGELDAWSKVKYLMVPIVLGSLSVPFYVLRPVYGTRAPALNSLFSFVFGVLAAYLACWGLRRCFLANNEIDGKAFFEQITILMVPILIRIIVLGILGSLGLLIVIANLKDRVPALFYRASILVSALSPILTYVAYVMLVNSIRRLGRLLETR
jgi:small-conductance mechanosensitive channel